MPYDIITFGSATHDVFLSSKAIHIVPAPEFLTGQAECVALGSKVDADAIHFDTGGGATNAAATFARLGYKTAAVCRMGYDRSGTDVLDMFKKEKIKTDFVQITREDHTAYSILLSAGTVERTAIIYRGASQRIEHKKVPWDKVRAQWFYVTSLAGDLAFFRHILTAARICHAKIAWNPGGGELRAGMDRLKPLIDTVDVFMVNREEAASLVGLSITRLDPILREFQKRKCGLVVVTDGQNGADAVHGQKLIHIGVLDVPRVNTTGAGDAFGSGFVVGFMKKEKVDEGLRVAIINANSVVQKLGAKSGIIRVYPTPSELRKVPTTTISVKGKHEH